MTRTVPSSPIRRACVTRRMRMRACGAVGPVRLPAAAAAQVPAGAEFQVNTYTTGSQFVSPWPSDAGGASSWSGERSARTARRYGVFAQRFDAAGAPLGAEFQVNTYTTGQRSGSRPSPPTPARRLRRGLGRAPGPETAASSASSPSAVRRRRRAARRRVPGQQLHDRPPGRAGGGRGRAGRLRGGLAGTTAGRRLRRVPAGGSTPPARRAGRSSG